MAKILLGATIGDARGSAGAIVYSRNSFGAYIRQKVSPVQPRTDRQTAVRQLFSDLSIRWGSVLDDAKRAAWMSLAAANPVVDVFGNSQTLTGLQLFQRVNRNMQEIDLPIMDTAPADQSVLPLTAVSVTSSFADQTLDVVFTPAPQDANHGMLVFATPPLSPGKAYYKPLLRKISMASGGLASPWARGAAYVAKFGAIPLGQRIGLKMFAVCNLNGAASSDMYFDCIVGA